ncbi:hypothetical protein [Lactobacillus helveticus]|uniref:hypothetical protein n=1 Tax=Lactobacillus helveticus TaxID=1587 RepID=UPI00062A7528|nr:hypothetical protein [Lactobacillus helveticus]AKG67072.1 hypothetical protein TU99_07510 [Lactobacillus helveticus]
MTKAIIHVYARSETVEAYEVDDFKIDDNLIVAEDDTDRFIFPLSSIMMIEVSHDSRNERD